MVRRKERIILHSDINNCFASIECVFRPELKKVPMAVGGNKQERHGIILAKNQIAKGFGVKTGEALWEAKQKCPNLIIVPPRVDMYLDFSKRVFKIYEEYTNQIESFGIDECWLDVTGSQKSGYDIAEEIRQRIKTDLGVTVSVGVSFNKIFAKLGSDYKKPDAVTVISKENFKEKIWGLPAIELLSVGPATNKKLNKYGVTTIGQLAQTPIELLQSWFGKTGCTIWRFANGLDNAPVEYVGTDQMVKSVGNGRTAHRDLESNQDVKVLIYALAESVASRIRKIDKKAEVISVSVKNKDFVACSAQHKLEMPTDDANEIGKEAFALFLKNYNWLTYGNIRAVTISGSKLVDKDEPVQMDIYTNPQRLEKRDNLNKTVDLLRGRYGYTCLRRAVVMSDLGMKKMHFGG
ncbi:MAG: DNA polymerase IV [Clostridiales bacterium]|nr:DNA polymerase IV [Clostridiales bacterium]